MVQVILQTFFNLSNQNWTLHSCYSLCNFTIYYCFTVGPRPGTRALRQSCLLLRTAATGWQSFVEPCVRHRGPLVVVFCSSSAFSFDASKKNERSRTVGAVCVPCVRQVKRLESGAVTAIMRRTGVTSSSACHFGPDSVLPYSGRLYLFIYFYVF